MIPQRSSAGRSMTRALHIAGGQRRMRRKVLISGALGYLGGRVAQHLAARNGLELLLGTTRRRARPQWLRHGRVIALDVLDAATVEAACKQVDTVIHLAAADENASAADPA